MSSENIENEVLENESSEENPNKIKCPDCQKEYPKPTPGVYRCSNCLCKFVREPDGSIRIIPFFDEMSIEPILIMLGVLGVVMLVASGDQWMTFMERLNLFLLIGLTVLVFTKGVSWACSNYRGADRFFRRWSFRREARGADPDALIKIDYDKKNR